MTPKPPSRGGEIFWGDDRPEDAPNGGTRAHPEIAPDETARRRRDTDARTPRDRLVGRARGSRRCPWRVTAFGGLRPVREDRSGSDRSGPSGRSSRHRDDRLLARLSLLVTLARTSASPELPWCSLRRPAPGKRHGPFSILRTLDDLWHSPEQNVSTHPASSPHAPSARIGFGRGERPTGRSGTSSSPRRDPGCSPPRGPSPRGPIPRCPPRYGVCAPLSACPSRNRGPPFPRSS